MRLERLCALDLKYDSDFHYVSPYPGESGIGWGTGGGTATGDRLQGTVQWSNQPTGRGDGVMLPSARGVITTSDGAEVMFDLTGRTVFVDLPSGETAGRQLLMTLFETEHDSYRWLNNTVCVTEGKIDPERLVTHMEVWLCHADLTCKRLVATLGLPSGGWLHHEHPRLSMVWRWETADPGVCVDQNHPHWSPDGHRIAYEATSSGPGPDDHTSTMAIFTMNLDGTDVRRVPGTRDLLGFDWSRQRIPSSTDPG